MSIRTKLNPNVGVAQAVASVKEHKTFKRMLMFALRSLAEFCSESTINYKENAIDALFRDVIPFMTDALKSFPDNEDICSCVAKILCAMAIAAKEEADPSIKEKMNKDGAIQAMLLIIATVPHDIETVESSVVFIETVINLGMNIDYELLASPLLSIISKEKFHPKLGKKIILALLLISNSKNGVKAIKDAGGVLSVLDYCLNSGDFSEDSVLMLENTFDICRNLAENNFKDPEMLNHCMLLMDKYKNKKSASAKGNSALSAMVGPEELRKCLSILKSASPGTQEHDEALTMLSSMSYISSYSNEIVKAGGIVTLVSLINNSLTQIELNPDKIYPMISGASRMLGRIASNPANVDAIAKVSGVQSLCVALSYCHKNNEVIGALCFALAPFATSESYVSEMMKYEAFNNVLPLLYENVESKELAVPAMELIITACQHPCTHSHMIENKAVEFVATCCQYHTDDTCYQINSMNVLNRLSNNLRSVNGIYEFGGLGGIVNSLSVNKHNQDVALAAVQLCEKLSSIPDATTYMCDGTLVDAILEEMLEHENNEILTSSGINTLAVIATDQDCSRHMEGLRLSVQRAANDPDRVYKSLSAVFGLSKVSHLKVVFENNNADLTILDSVKSWVEGPKFEGEGKIIQAALKTATALKLNSSGDLTNSICTICEIASLPQIRSIVESQELNDNVMIQCISCICELAETARVTGEENIERCVEGTLKIMKKYTEFKAAQLLCLKALNYFAFMDNAKGVQVLVRSGVIKTILSYLNKSPMYLDVQVQGFTVLAMLVKDHPESVEMMKKCNALQALQTALRTHNKSKELKRVAAPLLTLLMPCDAVESEIKDKIIEIEESMQTGDFNRLYNSLRELNELLVTPEGSKIGNRCGVPQAMAKVETYFSQNERKMNEVQHEELNGKDFYDANVYEVANSIVQVSGSRAGCAACTKSGNVNTLINLFESLKSPNSEVTEEAAIKCLEGLRILLTHDNKNVDIAFQRKFVRVLCNVVSNYPNSGSVLTNAAKCLAAISNSNSAKSMDCASQPEFKKLLQCLKATIEDSPQKLKEQAIDALIDLLKSNNEDIVKAVKEAGLVGSLIKVISENPDDPEITRKAARALAMMGNDDSVRNYLNNDVRETLGALNQALDINKNNAETASALLDCMDKFTTTSDRSLLSDLGALETVAEVMMLHHDNPEITASGGELFAKMGADAQIKAIMQQIIQAVQSNHPDLNEIINNLVSKLSMFLAAPLENPADALQHTEQCLGCLNQCLINLPDDARLHSNIASVARRLCDRCYNDNEDPYGAWAVLSSGMGHQLCNMINTGVVSKNKKFLVPAFRILSALAVNQYCTPTLKSDLAPLVLPNTYNLLSLHQKDPEVVSRILEFLSHLAEDPENVPQIMELNGPEGDIIMKTLNLMNENKKSDPVCVNGMELLGNLATNWNNAINHPAFASGTVLKECEKLCSQEPSFSRQAAHINLVEKLLKAGICNDAIKNENVLERLISNLTNENDLNPLTDSQKAELYGSFIEVLEQAANAGMIPEIEKCKGFDVLMRAIDEHPEDPNILKKALPALTSLALASENMAARVSKEAIPKLAIDSSSVLQTDPECANTFLDLLNGLAQYSGVGKNVEETSGIPEILQGIEQLSDYYNDEFGTALKEKLALFRKAAEDNQPKEKTCKDVYDLLNDKVEQNLSVAISEAALLLDEMNFLFTQMGQYGAEKLNHQTFIGSDHQWGNMAFEIFCNEEQNLTYLNKGDFVKFELACIKDQPDELVVYNAIKALCAYTKHKNGAQECGNTAGCPTITSEAVGRIYRNTTFNNEEKETQLLPRLLLVERVALNRNLFNKTSIVNYLIGLWDNFDNRQYSTILLRQVFRTMRRVVSDAHVEELLRANVLKRLTLIINDTRADVVILPDVLFLLGSLAVVPEIKTKIGEIEGVDACVLLLRRSLSLKNGTSVITNCCLALANICIGHKKNAAIFQRLKGPDLNVEVLQSKCAECDICNAASVLLCNVLYKNDAMKKYYGSNGAAAALVHALKQYDGSEEKNAIRYLQSLFKAISNMSLYTSNIPLFLNAGIENSYVKWLSNLSPTFPDSVLETGLRTFSNLVIENEESNMKKFGCTLKPCLDVVKQDRSDSKAISLLLDIIFYLCRYKENAKLCPSYGGIDIMMDIISRFDNNISILNGAVRVIGVQSIIPANIQLLFDADVCSVLNECLEIEGQGVEITELAVGCLRCIRRLVQSYDFAMKFKDCGGIRSIVNSILKSEGHPMIILEACRVILCLLNFTGSESKENASEDEYMGDISEEKEEYDIPSVNPPENPHLGWKKLDLDELTISSILQTICECIKDENHTKHIRLQRLSLGLCTYFASERLALDSLICSNFNNCITSAMTYFAGDPGICLTCTYAINNIALSSGDLYESFINPQLISAFKEGISKLPNGKKNEEKELKSKCQKTYEAMKSGLDPFEAFANFPVEFPISCTEWNVDPYPNGVQDLPSEKKEQLRKGGKCKVFIGEKAREEMKFRASQDLNMFEYSLAGDNDFVNRVPIIRIKSITKGLAHESLINANRKEPMKVQAKTCFCIKGPSTEDNPDGIELPIKMKTQKERDSIVDILVMWRDAATYNF